MLLNALVEKLKRRSKDDFKGRHYEATLILQAVSWYLRYPLSYRDIEELFLERGLEVDHSTLNRWVLAYAPLIERRLRAFRKPHCGSIRVDETSYEDGCVKPVLFSAGRHRSFPRVLAFLGAEVELRTARVPSPTSYPAGRRPRYDPLFGSEELRGERRHSPSAALSGSPRLVPAAAPSAPPGQLRLAGLARSVYLRAGFLSAHASCRATVSVSRSGRLQFHPLRHGAVLEVSPERDQELSRQGDDHDLAQAAPRAAQAIVEPARERTAGLVAQPHPGEFNERRAQPPVAVLADPLLAVRAAAAVGRSSQPGVGAKRAGVAEPAHEGLVDQHGRGLHTDAAHTDEPLDHLLRLPRRLVLDGLVALRFQVGHLLADQVEAIEQTLDLRPSVRRKGLVEGGAQLPQPLAAVAPQRVVLARTEHGQHRLDPVDNGHPRADQLLALAYGAAGILSSLVRHRHHRANPRLAAQPGQEGAQQHVGVDTVGLSPAHAAVHGHAGGLHHMHLDTALLQPARKPETAPAGLVGDDHSVHRPAGRRRTAFVALDRCHERVGAGRELLLGALLPEARHLGGDDPAATTDLDSEDQRAVVVQPIVGGDMGMLGHGSAPGDGDA